MGTEIASIYVGADCKHFVVHKKLLTSQSEYFDKALNGKFREAEENTIHLKEDDPVAVGLLIAWLYRGVIPGSYNKINPFARLTQNSLPESTDPIPYPDMGTVLPFASSRLSVSYPGQNDSLTHICSDDLYNNFSPEELRMADYRSLRRYGPSVGSVFGAGAGVGALPFGNPPPPPPPIAPPGTSLFGTALPPTPSNPAVIGASVSVSITPNNGQQHPAAPSTSSNLQTLAHPNPPPAAPTNFFASWGRATPSGGASFGRPSAFSGVSGRFSKKPDLRPGDFGYCPTVNYPESKGEYIDGISPSKPLRDAQEDQDARQDSLLHLCILAETIIWPKLFNAAIDAYVQGELSLLRNIPTHHIETIYERTIPGSPLREFAIDSLQRLSNAPIACKEYMTIAQQHEEFLEAVILRLSTMHVGKSVLKSIDQIKTYYIDEGAFSAPLRDRVFTGEDKDEEEKSIFDCTV
jgi:hypothetical protein